VLKVQLRWSLGLWSFVEKVVGAMKRVGASNVEAAAADVVALTLAGSRSRTHDHGT
jgi:hypothetical protein